MADKVDVLADMQVAEDFIFRDAASKGFKTSVGGNELRAARRATANLIAESLRLLKGVDTVNGFTVVQEHDLANFRLALDACGVAP